MFINPRRSLRPRHVLAGVLAASVLAAPAMAAGDGGSTMRKSGGDMPPFVMRKAGGDAVKSYPVAVRKAGPKGIGSIIAI